MADEMIERVKLAVSRETGISSRVNKGSALPFEVIDLGAGGDPPVVLSAWGSLRAADEAVAEADATRRARAVIAAMREPSDAMVDASRDTIWDFSPDYSPYIRGSRDEYSAEEIARRAWRKMIDTALGN